MAIAILFAALGLFTAYYLLSWLYAGRERPGIAAVRPTPEQLGIGFVTNFFDTLGVGSFATTTSYYKFRKLVEDHLIPGTLNVGHTLPAILQAFIYIAIIQVDVTTLVLMIGGAVVGSWLGAGVVSRWPRRKIQIGMGIALLVAAAVMLVRLLNVVRGAGTLSLEGARLVAGVAGNFVLGALMTLGIGLYAPCLVLVGLLGMVETTAFPIMMGSCAFLMPVASARFLRVGRLDARAAAGLGLGGIPAVIIAAKLVESMPLAAVKWLVVAVVVYTAIMMLRSAARERGAAEDR